MPYVHCNECHHEWECAKGDEGKCDWCGGDFYILEDETPLSNMLKKVDVIAELLKLNNPLADKVIKKIKDHPKKK